MMNILNSHGYQKEIRTPHLVEAYLGSHNIRVKSEEKF